MKTCTYFCFKYRDDAVTMLNQLKDLVDIYGLATISDLYDLANRCSTPEHESYGWIDLRFAKVKFLAPYKWTLELPEPILLTYKEKEMKDTKQTFTRDDLKAGYIIKLRDGTCRSIQMVGRETLIAVAGSGDKNWTYVSRGWDPRMEHRDHGGPMFPYPTHDKTKDIVAVYGYVQGSEHYCDCGVISTDYRPLIWSRVDPKKMTVEEIEKELGYRVEIVSD